MKGWMKIGLSAFLLVMFVLLERSALATPDVNEAKKQSAEMLEDAKAMIESAQKALDSIPPGNMHGEFAASHIKSAIEHAKAAIDKQSLDHAEEALTHAKEGNQNVQQM